MTDHEDLEFTALDRLVAGVLREPLLADVETSLRDRLMEIHDLFDPVPEPGPRKQLGWVVVIGSSVTAIAALLLVSWIWLASSGQITQSSPPAIPSVPAVPLPTPAPAQTNIPAAVQFEPEPGYGSLIGQVVLRGTAPASKPLSTTGLKDVSLNAACGPTIPDDTLLIEPQTGGVANVFVYLIKPRSIHPSLADVPPTATFHAKCGQFHPHVLCLQPNQSVLVRSLDPFPANVHSLPLKNMQSNVVVGAKPISLSMTVQERLPFKVIDDIHPWMSAYWLVLDHPYATVTDQHGRFAIHKLPAGDCEFRIWHERAGFLEKSRGATIKSEETHDCGVIFVSGTSFK